MEKSTSGAAIAALTLVFEKCRELNDRLNRGLGGGRRRPWMQHCGQRGPALFKKDRGSLEACMAFVGAEWPVNQGESGHKCRHHERSSHEVPKAANLLAALGDKREAPKHTNFDSSISKPRTSTTSPPTFQHHCRQTQKPQRCLSASCTHSWWVIPGILAGCINLRPPR